MDKQDQTEPDEKPAKELKNPRVATVKRLYAVSGNQCAFPGCKLPLVDTVAGVVTSKICHIKARSPKGPRYHATQAPEVRHGYNNLLLLCGRHHDIIDQDDENFSVEDLIKMKHTHEAKHAGDQEPVDADEAAAMLYGEMVMTVNIAHNIGNTLYNGSTINAMGQLGGQAAHSITNEAASRRTISSATADRLAQQLRRYAGRLITFTGLWGDEEAFRFAASLMQIFDRAGWSCDGVTRSMFQGPVAPLNLVVHPAGPLDNTFHEVARWLKEAGLPVFTSANETYEAPAIIAGTNM